MYPVYMESSHELSSKEAIINYIRGGKGVVCLESPSGKSRFYAFRTPLDPENFANNTLFVYGQVSNGTWLYCGMVLPDLTFKLTISSTWGKDSEVTKGVEYIMSRMLVDGPDKCSMKLYHAGVCCICGHKLTSYKSICDGIGSKCKKQRYQHGST